MSNGITKVKVTNAFIKQNSLHFNVYCQGKEPFTIKVSKLQEILGWKKLNDDRICHVNKIAKKYTLHIKNGELCEDDRTEKLISLIQKPKHKNEGHHKNR